MVSAYVIGAPNRSRAMRAPIIRELARLFIGDGWLVLAILGVLVLAAVVSALMPDLLATAMVLLLGCFGLLLVDVAGTARRRTPARSR
jgi:hypothetical protein